MSTQKEILNLLDTELNKLVNTYEEKIKNYEEQVSILLSRIDKLVIQNKLYQDKVVTVPSASLEKLVDLPVEKSELHSKDITIDYIDEICITASNEDAVLLLEALNRSLVDFDIDKLTYGFDSIITNSKILMHDTEEVSKRFLDLVEIILLDDKLSEQAYDELISSLLNLLIEMESAPFREKTIDLLKLKNEKIFDYILVRNEPKIITIYLRMLLVYGMKEHVETALIHLLDIEWGFIDSSLSKEDFTFFLWYTFFFDLDGDLIDQSSISLQWLNVGYKDQALYFYCKDEHNKTWADYSNEIEQFKNGNVLTNFEKDLIIKKLKRKLKPRSKSGKSQLITINHNEMASANPNNSFSWPSTEVAEVKNDKNDINNTEEKTLNERSELIKLGYQISGTTRPKRWAILEKAVPELGLKKIAYTISYNVKLRKGQKNGIKKFHYAITEWEYDLAKLKKHYYKNDFNWPKS